MRRSTLLVVAVLVSFGASLYFLVPSRAQVVGRPDPADAQLAAAIRTLADRRPEGLIETRRPDGSMALDLEKRFQNVSLVKAEGGEPIVGCVSSVEEANSFFGRNLETGEA